MADDQQVQYDQPDERVYIQSQTLSSDNNLSSPLSDTETNISSIDTLFEHTSLDLPSQDSNPEWFLDPALFTTTYDTEAQFLPSICSSPSSQVSDTMFYKKEDTGEDSPLKAATRDRRNNRNYHQINGLYS